jgi:hypothetical protein
MNKKEKMYNRFGLKFGLIITIIALIITAGASIQDISEFNAQLEKTKYLNGLKPDGEWHMMARINPLSWLGGTDTDFLEIFYINLSDGDNWFANDNVTSNLENTCDANDLGYVTADDIELDIAHSTAFAIVARVKGDSDHCKRGSDWWDTDLNCTLTWNTDGYSLNDVQPDHVTDYSHANGPDFNTSAYTFLYKHFVWDNSNNGFQISKGANTGDDPIIELAAYY